MTEPWSPATSRFAATASDGASTHHEASGNTMQTGPSGPSLYGPAASSHSQMDIIFSSISFSSLTRNKKPLDPADIGPGGIYHEKQAGLLCAMHTINNVIQENRISEEILRKTAKQLDKAAHRLTGGRSTDYRNYREDGFYNALVVQAVFSGLGFHVQSARASMLHLEDEMAVLANKARHWFGCRRLGDGWFDLNSCLSKPEYYEEHEFQELLVSAEDQGYRLFVVRGDWPPTALEEDPSALTDAKRGCMRPMGYGRSTILCAPGLDQMVDENMKRSRDPQIPFWLGFSAHWFSPTRFQHHPAGSAEDWQAAELGWRRKRVTVKKKSKNHATLQEAKVDGQMSEGKKEMSANIMEVLQEEDIEEWFEEEIEDTEIALEDELAARPIFVLVQVTLIVLFWLIASCIEPGEHGWLFTVGGFENLLPGQTLCQAYSDCKDLRFQAWRWWSYQLTHTGVSHVGTNSFILLLCGLPLEQFQGSLRTFLLYNAGIFTGGIFNLAWNPHSQLAGCSAGNYALIFAHFAELGMNWKQSRYRWAKFFTLLLLVIFDILQFTLTADFLGFGIGAVSHMARIGGALTGLLIGVCLTRNLVMKRWERIGQLMAFLAFLIILGIHFGLLSPWPPREIYNPTPWCWARQVFNQTLWNDGEYHCVRCADDACIARWSAQRWVAKVNWQICEYQRGWN